MLQVTVQIGSVSTQQDRGNKLVIYTPELTLEQMVELFRLKNDGECLCAFQPIGRQAPDLPPNTNETKLPSLSKQLRNTLYKLWEQQHAGAMEFEAFYDFELNKIIEHFKNKLT